MLLTRTRYIPSRKTVDERIILTDATLLKKTTFFFLLLSFILFFTVFSTSGLLTSRDRAANKSGFVYTAHQTTFQQVKPQEYLLTEVLPRGRIFFEKYHRKKGYLDPGLS